MRGRERDFLFIHLTLSGSPQETADLTQQLVYGLARRFYTASGSVTAALRRSVIAINEELLRLNLDSKTPREGALTCAVLHASELYTLQVGEGLAFLGHNFGVERLPAKPPAQITPLGRTVGLDMRFAYHRLQSGDMMLLAEPRLGHLNGTSLAPVLVDTEIETGLDALVALVARDTARLLLIEFADELPSTLPVTFVHSRQPASNTLELAAKPATTTATATTATRAGSANAATGVADTPATSSDSGEPVMSGMAVGARRVASSSARGLSRATGWLAVLLGYLGLSREEEEKTPVSWAIPTVLSIVLPILIASILTGTYIQRDTVEAASALKQDMVQQMNLAEEQSADPEVAREHYNAVIALAATAEAVRPRDLEVARLRGEARDALDRMDGVARLSATSVFQYGDETQLSAVVLRGEVEGAVVLDQAGERVLLHPADPVTAELSSDQPATLGFRGQAVGAQVMGPFVDVMWLPSGAAATRDAVAMLDRNGVLYLYYPNLGDIRAVTLGDSSSWSDPRAIATYSGRLYVLDSGKGIIWKYYPQDSGFVARADDPAVALGPEAELSEVIDFDLYSEDGSLVLLYRDGRIRYIDTRSGRVQWDENTLLNNGLNAPFVAPTSVELVGRGLNASIFVLDPGNGRLVQLSRGGTVLAQYRAIDPLGNEVLSKSADFAVSESPFRVFLAAGDQLYAAER